MLYIIHCIFDEINYCELNMCVFFFYFLFFHILILIAKSAVIRQVKHREIANIKVKIPRRNNCSIKI